MPFQIIRNDITKVAADAIVNTANPRPVIGGGTDSAIYQAAGEEQLLEARQKIGPIARGEAAVTPAFGLQARYIIHTVGPVWDGGTNGEEDTLRSCYRNCLRLAREMKCGSVAFPMISAGVYGFPRDRVMRIALTEFSRFLMDPENETEMSIILVVFDRKSSILSGKLFPGLQEYIDDRYAEAQRAEEYGYDRQMRAEDRRYGRNERTETYQDVRNERADRRSGYRGLNSEKVVLPGLRERRNDEEKGWNVFESQTVREDSAFPLVDENERLESELSEEPAAQRSVSAASPTRKPRKLADVVGQTSESFQERLFRLIDERGMTNVEVYKGASMDKKLFSKINSNRDYQPKKNTVLALAISLRLNLDETTDLLALAGLALSPYLLSDRIVKYFIETGKYEDIYDVEFALGDYGQKPLGSYS